MRQKRYRAFMSGYAENLYERKIPQSLDCGIIHIIVQLP